MPSSKKDVAQFFERLAIMETKVQSLMVFQKWQMGCLAAIILLLLTKVIK